jgi:hypothetical protein
VTVGVQNEVSEISGRAACQDIFQFSGPKLKSNSLIDTDKSSTKTRTFLRETADGNFLKTI